jgi:hypothetical protein
MGNIRNDRGKASIDETPSSLNPPTIEMMMLEINRTNVYTEIDLEMKRKKLQVCEKFLTKAEKRRPSWKRDPSILEWLSKL